MFPAVAGLGLSLTLAGFVGGCASSPPASSAPKPGRGIAEYREVALGAKRSVAATVKSLEALAQPGTARSGLHPAVAGLDRAVSQLELDSVKARARAEAIIARGEAYFEEWKESLAGRPKDAATQAEALRFERLFDRFARVRQRSGAVREEFRPFMAALREYRARLDPTAQAAHREPAKADLEDLTKRGRQVLETLAAVLTALDEAEAELKLTQTQ